MLSDQPIFYVYVYLDPRKPGNYVYGEYSFEYEPFYVGKGSNGRAYKYKQKGSRCSEIVNIILLETTHPPNILIYNEGLSEGLAYSLEERMIAVIGRVSDNTGPLCNVTVGGYGVGSGENHPMFGRHHSSEARKKISQAGTGRVFSTETRQKISDKRSGYTTSESAKKNMSIARSGEKHHNYGKHLPEITRQRISDATRGENSHMYGKHHTDEVKQKMSDSLRPYGLSLSKKYIIEVISTGEVLYITGLTTWCKEHPEYGANQAKLTLVAQGKRNHHKGLRCRYDL